MTEKPKRASEYKSEQVELVRAACLYVATRLGDMMDDLLIVGGLVPSLIIDQENLGEEEDRGENKDAYDLYYVVRNYGSGPGDVAAKLRPLLDDSDAQRAMGILERDFSERVAVGPMRVAAFVTGGQDDALQADVVGFVGELLTKVRGP